MNSKALTEAEAREIDLANFFFDHPEKSDQYEGRIHCSLDGYYFDAGEGWSLDLDLIGPFTSRRTLGLAIIRAKRRAAEMAASDIQEL